MSIKVVLFDLDGTLLPMDQDSFINAYITELAKRLASDSLEIRRMVKSIFLCSEAMLQNNGEKTNESVFWDTYSKLNERDLKRDKEIIEDFYQNGFDKMQTYTSSNAKANEIIKRIRSKGLSVVLATNPVFPRVATEKRISWAGIDANDFTLCTTFENSSFTKPNPKYYESILSSLGIKAEEALMVGNDVGDDMVARDIGMSVFLLTDNLINRENANISEFPNGNFDDLMTFFDFILQ